MILASLDLVARVRARLPLWGWVTVLCILGTVVAVKWFIAQQKAAAEFDHEAGCISCGRKTHLEIDEEQDTQRCRACGYEGEYGGGST